MDANSVGYPFLPQVSALRVAQVLGLDLDPPLHVFANLVDHKSSHGFYGIFRNDPGMHLSPLLPSQLQLAGGPCGCSVGTKKYFILQPKYMIPESWPLCRSASVPIMGQETV